jgi:TonB-linked SusC/RagA family outer membrane protein
MAMTKIKFLLTVLLCIVSSVMMAQGTVISGTVEDAMGPVMLANVTERDANDRIVNATQTDMMGNFSMEIKNTKNKLVVSYVGSKTWSKVIGDNTTFAIKLEDEKTTLNEVTVRGRRANSGGLNIQKKEISVTQQTFNLSEVEGMAFTSADEALQGEIAGLDIVSNSGNLGSGSTMRLRGVSTINGSAEPLIVVDDKIFDTPDDYDFDGEVDPEKFSALLSVSVDDIADIRVLKDAAATAIWGSQGANGVIMITTKRGSRGKPKVNFSYKFSGTWLPAGYNLLSGDDYTMMLKEELYNPSQNSSATTTIREINYDKSWADYENWNNNTDWLKAITQFGQQHEYNMNISGGGQKATFRISAGYNHQTGTVIKQTLDRLTTRLVLDYNVSDRIRFSTNFALTYTDNVKNYTLGSSADNSSHNNLLNMALQMAPNAAIYRQDSNGNDTSEFFIMNPTQTGKTPYDGNYTSDALKTVAGIGNPVAYANNSWQKEQVYQIVPDFNIKYELLGTESNQHRLTFNGRVYFDIYAKSAPTYMPGGLTSNRWDTDTYNELTKTEANQLKVGTRAELIFTPYFRNQDLSLTMLARYEAFTTKYTSQYIAQYNVPNGISSPSVIGAYKSMSSSNSRSATQNWLYNAHFSYKERYIIGFSLRADGDSRFGPENPWFYAPSVSLRYNLSDEKFFEPLRKYVSMLGIRASWGITGSSKASADMFYNTYTMSGSYGKSSGTTQNVTYLDILKLDDLKPQKKIGYNLGFNLGLLSDKVEFDLNLYKEDTKDLLMQNVTIPSTTGFATIKYGNIGEMSNKGWELTITGNKFIKYKKLSVSASFNIAQNNNELISMDERVLNALNETWTATNRGASSRLTRVQVGNPLCSIYGYEFKGVYQYSYDYLSNYNTEMSLSDPTWNSAKYETWINEQLAQGRTFPVATDANGNVIMTSNGEPQHLVYNYDNGKSTYTFQGGDAIYEDINHDGQINNLDIKYLGNSLPKMQGGFSLTLQYGQWKMIARFNYRWGNKIFNTARMNLESMYGTGNQCSSVNWRWRKDGDVTPIPRAMFNTAYNYQASSRFVEDGSFLRFQNLQISYSFPKKLIKNWGLSTLAAYFTMNNLFCWTKYSGIDPEISASTYAPAIDSANTPRSKSFTASINIGF